MHCVYQIPHLDCETEKWDFMLGNINTHEQRNIKLYDSIETIGERDESSSKMML